MCSGFKWKISAEKRFELSIALWGDWPRQLLGNLPYFVLLQRAITSTRHSFLAHQNLYDDKQFYLPLPRRKLHSSSLYDNYVEYIIRVLRSIGDRPERSIDQTGDATQADFENLFTCEPARNRDVQKRLTRQRILWVIQRVTMIELNLDSEVFVSSVSSRPINKCFRESDYFANNNLPLGRRRPSSSISVLSLSDSAQEAPKTLSQNVLNVQNIVAHHSISIQWVNDPLCHLSMPSDNILQLFCHASWCKSHGIASARRHDLSICSLLGIPASYFDEILLTYRLLFDEFSLASTQKYYQLTHDPERSQQQTQLQCRDIFMDITCGMKHRMEGDRQGVFIDYSRFEDGKRRSSGPHKKRWTTDDFPHLRDRLETLQTAISSSKAEGLGALWKYERGSMSWFAFW